MSIVRVAVPVLQGRRRFHFDKGRPWSILERVTLVALVQSSRTASELATQANVPKRLIIESLVRLMRAGWVQMNDTASGVIFNPTQSGILAAVSDELPSITKRMKRTMTFVVDQISGGIFRSRELPFLHTHMVEERASKESIIWIERPSRVFNDAVQPLLDTLFSDDERFVAMDATGERLADRWSLVTVRDGEPDGLTHRASPELVEAIKLAARTSPSAREGSNVVPLNLPSVQVKASNETYNLNVLANDILVGGKEHRDIFETALKKARHRIIIHSTFISQHRFDALLPQLKDAHSRGVKIDILWGQDSQLDELRSTRKTAIRLRERLRELKLERLVVHPFSTQSHSKFLLFDTGTQNQFRCVVGSCNWLYSSFESVEISVVLRDPRIISDALNELSELSRGKAGQWTDFTNELVSLSSFVRKLQPTSAGAAKVSLVKGMQHAELVRVARDAANVRIVVLSHRFSNAARTIVLAPAIAAAKNRGVNTEIFYGIHSGTMTGAELAGLVRDGQKSHIKIVPVHDPRLHAKLLAWDDDNIVVTSQNWLSADPPDDAPRQEIGVHISERGIARLTLERFYAQR